MNILLVDSNAMDRARVKRALKRASFEGDLLESNSASSAKLAMDNEIFDLVLLDVTLPDMNALDVIEYIKLRFGYIPFTLIVVSNEYSDTLMESTIKAGAHNFLPKHEITKAKLKRVVLESTIRRGLEADLLESQKQLKKLAEHDSLTGLSNRYMFETMLNETLKHYHRSKRRLALLMIDIDNFKFINDNYGHHVGNQVLIRVSARIKSCLRVHENLYRIGGDEFAIVLQDIKDEHEASSVALRINRVLKKPFEIDNQEVKTNASIGISISPTTAFNQQDLVKFADIAMYRAKEKGKGQTCFFEESMQTVFLQRFEIDQDLRKALYKKQFTLHYQTINNRESLKINGFESLLRWNNNGQNIPPDLFIPIAEACGVILELGRWIISTAIRQLSEWHKIDSSLYISINLSPVQLSDKDLKAYIASCLNDFNVDAHKVHFELTETAFLDSTGGMTHAIEAIHELGCSLALDDFGTGYSSLSHLLNFPIQTVKIDKSILPGSDNDSDIHEQKKQRLFRGLINMLAALKLRIVVEGVETQTQLQLCQSLGVDFLQGYFLSKPEPSEHVTERLMTSIHTRLIC